MDISIAYNGARPRVNVNVSFRRLFYGWRIKLHNAWGAFKTYSRESFCNFHVIMRKVDKMFKVILMMIYSINIFKLALLFAFILINVLKNSIEKAESLMVVPQIFGNEFAEIIKKLIPNYEPIYQVGICILVVSLFAVLCRPVADLLTFGAHTAFSSNLSRKEKVRAIVNEAERLFDYYWKRLIGCCSGIVKIAGGTFVVWMVWNFLSR